MNERPKLFGTAGIRGPFGSKVTADLVFQVSQAVSKIYPTEGIVVGHDARTSSEALSQCATAAVSLAGNKAYIVGLCTFPVIANLTLDEKHTIAIYITASHNPPADNGIKVLRDGREFVEDEQNEIENLIVENRKKSISILHEKWDTIIPQGVITNANDMYKTRLMNEIIIDGEGKEVILDCANGPMSELAPTLLSELGFQVTAINSHVDGYFPGRLAEPSPGNLSVLMNLCRKEKLLGFAFDGDGDRLAVIDENGIFIELSRINALLATLVIKEHGQGEIIVSIDSSTTIDKIVEKYGIEVVRTKLGELHTKGKELIDQGKRIVFAAEPWKPIFPNWGFWIDGLYALLKFLKVIISRKTTVSEVMREIPIHIAERKAYLVEEGKVIEIFEKCKTKLKESMSSEKKKELTIDGLRYDFEDGTWILIRKSGTEPKIRIYYESPTQERFDWIERTVRNIEEIIENRGN
ncbi:MAG: hypothetical protein KAS63_03665 [Candidatus Heimdallarchaeota archaeon]|nr:hypothetical protein [Candidatus Heimdallarchaeota archaeon]MCK4954431.1 hypothetical protein [Candidatus Heimdallarchaeota archaeon]